MRGSSLFNTSIQGRVSTNYNREAVLNWRQLVENAFASLTFPNIDQRRLAVDLKFWLSQGRLQTQKNDLDNLAKPVLDSMKRIGIIHDDSHIFHLTIEKFPTIGEEGIYVKMSDWD